MIKCKEYKQQNCEKPVSMVLQDTWLFSGSIRDNIAYGADISNKEDFTDVDFERVEEAKKN